MFILILPEQDHAFGVYCPSVYREFIEIYSAGEREEPCPLFSPALNLYSNVPAFKGALLNKTATSLPEISNTANVILPDFGN